MSDDIPLQKVVDNEKDERGEGRGGREEDVVVAEREGGKGLYSAPRGSNSAKQ